jgi:hypothetical protein
MNKEELCKFICDLFGWDECNTMVLKQINKYVRECGYSYIDIARALSYYADIQGNTLDPKYGIGIVRFVMNDSRKYFEQLRLQKEAQMKKANEIKNTETVTIKCSIKSKKTIRKNQIDINKL